MEVLCDDLVEYMLVVGGPFVLNKLARTCKKYRKFGRGDLLARLLRKMSRTIRVCGSSSRVYVEMQVVGNILHGRCREITGGDFCLHESKFYRGTCVQVPSDYSFLFRIRVFSGERVKHFLGSGLRIRYPYDRAVFEKTYED